MKKQNGAIKRLLRFTRRYWGFLVLALLFAVTSVGLSLIAPLIIGRAIDYIVGPGQVDFETVARYLAFLGASMVLSAVFQWLMGLCTNQISYRTIRDLRQSVFKKLNDVPLKYIDGHPHGDIMSRVVNDVEQISDGLIQGFTQLFTGIITIVGTIVLMFLVNPIIAAVVIVITPLSLFVASFIAKRSHRSFLEQSATKGELAGYVEELVGNQKVVQAFSHEDEAQKKFEEIDSRLYKSGVRSQFYSSITNPSTRFVNAIVYASVGVAGAFGVLGYLWLPLSIGQLSSFLSYANQYTKPFNEITGVLTELQTALAAAQRVFEILDEPEEISDDNCAAISSADGDVEIRNVDFSYNPAVPLIDGFNLSVDPGEKVAVVGPTGCGKTTLINLLMRFYDVTKGEILVSGKPIRSLTRKSLRRQYGMVLQESWLFSGTVRENIAYGKEDATEEEIIAAAKAAHAHGFIMRLAGGYDAVITESGGNVSQGQKQLLCIARVMLVKPPMLILDEATSSIDTLTELRIQNAFSEMMKGRTSFIVAHRLSTIQEADTILVMNKGKIIEQGNHEELLEKGGFYAKLYRSQFAATK